jgi:RecB family exonuclease
MAIEGEATEWLTGRIDRVARDGDRILVIDWKTGTGVPRNPEEDWQTRLYLYALIEVAGTPSAVDLGLHLAGPLRPEQVQFVYVEVKADNHTPLREVVLPYSTAKHEATRQVLQAILRQMAVEEDYALPESGRCPDRFCAYRTICGIEALTGTN